MVHRNNRTDMDYQTKRIKYLFEFTVNKSEPMDSFSELNEEEPAEEPTEEIPAETPTPEAPVEEPTEEGSDVIEDVVMLHAQSIDNTLEYIEELLKIVDKQNNDIAEIKNNMSDIAHDVKQLIPPTPKEQLYNQMKKATPYMISVDEYWEEYEKKFKTKDPYYNDKTGQYEIDADKSDTLLDGDIKNSFY